MGSAYERLPLNALRVFEAVATRLNFGEAAEALHVTAAAVSQQIRALEDYLQTPLFRRDGRSVELTAEGKQLLPGVRRGLDELEASLQRLRADRRSGTINVSLLSSFLQKWLMPRLADLRARHPELDLRLHTSSEPVDFARSDFHAAIRLGPGHYPNLASLKLMDDWLVAVGSPELLRKHGPLPESGDLSGLPLLHGGDLDWSSWAAGGQALRDTGAYIDDSAGLTGAVIEGLGYAILRWSLVAADVAAGRIVCASDRILPYEFSYYFVAPEFYAEMPKVVAFRDWIAAQARAFAPPVPTSPART